MATCHQCRVLREIGNIINIGETFDLTGEEKALLISTEEKCNATKLHLNLTEAHSLEILTTWKPVHKVENGYVMMSESTIWSL